MLLKCVELPGNLVLLPETDNAGTAAAVISNIEKAVSVSFAICCLLPFLLHNNQLCHGGNNSKTRVSAAFRQGLIGHSQLVSTPVRRWWTRARQAFRPGQDALDGSRP